MSRRRIYSKVKKREKKAQMKSLFGDTVAYYTASSAAEDKHYFTYGRNRRFVGPHR